MPRLNDQLPAGLALSTVLADMDFETYSEAGQYFDAEAGRWRFLPGTPKGTTNPLAAVGAPVYAAHPSTEVLSLAYDLKDGLGERLWLPGMGAPSDLFEYLAAGGRIEAHNSGFERLIWEYVCTQRMGWPEVNPDQWRCSMAKCRAFGLPGALAKAGEALDAPAQKDADGTRLLNRFSKPRNPTKTDARLRIRPEDDPKDGPRLWAYNIDDIRAEAAISTRVPDLTPHELAVWQTDQRINHRGVAIDRDALADCLAIVKQADARYTAELQNLTGGAVRSASELQRLTGWLAGRGVHVQSLDADNVAALLDRDDLPPDARRAIEIRAALSATSVKKLYSIDRRISADGRLRELFAYCGAERTGRWAGRGPQPQNLPSGGPPVVKCDQCDHHYGASVDACPWCGTPDWAAQSAEWGADAVEDALAAIATRDLDKVARAFGDPVALVSGCLRGLFVAAPGHDFICADYSAIEAVVLAALAGDERRLSIFRAKQDIYLISAADITGTPLQELLDHKERTGEHHPLRKKVGKVAELASGYAGWIGAWKAFGADKHIGGDDDIKRAILKWRDANPEIVEMWGGQVRKHPTAWEFKHELYGLEGAAVQAIMGPGTCYSHRLITYGVKDDRLYCQLPSGRFLVYHAPRLQASRCRMSGLPIWQITFMGVDSVTGRWVRTETYGGKLTENVTQAVARDIQADALVRADAGGYPVVLHVHDEICSEVPQGAGSPEGLEAIMSTLPAWCADWPVRAAGGWRGRRYRKD